MNKTRQANPVYVSTIEFRTSFAFDKQHHAGVAIRLEWEMNMGSSFALHTYVFKTILFKLINIY